MLKKAHLMKLIAKLLVALTLTLSGCGHLTKATADDEYSIHAISYGRIANMKRSFFVEGETSEATLDIPLVIWVLQNDERTVLFDAGYFRDSWTTQWKTHDFISPDKAVEAVGISAEDVTDVIVSHMHWDHAQGAVLFPNATVWVQEAEYTFYTGEAWQTDGVSGGVDKRDVLDFVALNLEGRLRLVGGDDVEILPGIRAYTGGKHTFQSQYIRVAGAEPVVLASDNAYLYQNIETGAPINADASFDVAANRAAIQRMILLAGAPERVLPGHDPAIFERFPTEGTAAVIRE